MERIKLECSDLKFSMKTQEMILSKLSKILNEAPVNSILHCRISKKNENLFGVIKVFSHKNEFYGLSKAKSLKVVFKNLILQLRKQFDRYHKIRKGRHLTDLGHLIEMDLEQNEFNENYSHASNKREFYENQNEDYQRY